ncbi:hypothetical protein PHYBOEH_002238 [Phytophthora boehmeriae]|uniref:Uncharacterized protein n=1 Tax=Phytophthora boehmeriae TaxID=109152 RepID=A0A8T1WR00_9STRA|nr:hypothetical protein PHYBOEH_002238 [Phytophthora boehmeriae]
MTERKLLMDDENDFKPRQKKEKLTDSTAIDDQADAQPSVKSPRDMSLLIDIKGRGGRFSDDDSDGESAYSPACSDGENSPTPSVASVASSSCNSVPPLLRRPPETEYEMKQTEESGNSSLEKTSQERVLETKTLAENDKSHEEEPRLPVETMREKAGAGTTETPSRQQQQVKENAINVGGHYDDLPDWLHERIVLSPPASMPKMSMRSPQQIEDEIRLAVNSAAARVQQEINRREQFQNALQTAAAYTPQSPTIEDHLTAPKLAPTVPNDSGQFVNDVRDIPDVMPDEKQVAPPNNYDSAAIDAEDRDLLLVMEVVIGDGRAESIEVREGDNPTTLAKTFAQKYALKPDAVPKLITLLQQQLSAIAETEPEEAMQEDLEEITQEELADPNDWIHGTALNDFVQSTLASVADAEIAEGIYDSNSADHLHIPHPDEVAPQQREYVRDNHREYNYNNLVAKYGHYTQHSGKIDPDGRGARQAAPCDTLEVGDMQFEQQARAASTTAGGSERFSTSATVPAFTTMVSATRSNSSKKKDNNCGSPAYERLYALAESKQKWIQRAQKAKEIEQARDQERMHNVEIMAAKSRELIAHRTNGGYAHIGDRFHGEALSDLAKKTQRHEQRNMERERQQDWMCPKCAFANRYNDNQCQNAVARAGQSPVARTHQSGRQGKSQPVRAKVLCGQPKPERLFKPTLLTTSANVMKAVCANKEKTARVADLRRQRHQLALEEQFQQTCPFRPKINAVSEEIVREKLETAAAAAAVHDESPRQQRNPHHELYENAFHARAQREEQEQAYFSQFSFKPDIGVNALWVAPDKSQNDFVERLAVDKYRELERKRAALYDKYAPNRDPHTGKELFKPEIGRAPAFGRNKQGLPIGDFLYAAHQEQQEYHRQLREKDQREVKQKAQQNFVSEASRQALQRRKADTCSRIFKALLELSRQELSSTSTPGDTNGSISLEQTPTDTQTHEIKQDQVKVSNEGEVVTPSQVDLTALPAEISRVVAIVFEFADHAPISRLEFSEYMDRLVGEVPGLTYTQILFLAEHLHDGKGSRHRHQQHRSDPEREAVLAAAEQQELTFHPVIDKNSREIATKHGRVASSKVFETLNQYFDHYKERKEQLHKQHQREFKKAHPFQPTLMTKAHKREPAATAFYDKIHLGNAKDIGNAAPWEATTSESFVPTMYGNSGTPLPPPAPLQTVPSNARPSVRPIESVRPVEAERTRFYTAADPEEALLDELSGDISRSSSSSQLLEDADLTSRVLAALDDKPTTKLSSPSCSYHFFSPEKADPAKDDGDCTGKHGAVRPPEGATPDPALFDDSTDM